MSRLRDSERTKLIAEFIWTGKSPAGYEITVNESSKYKVRKLKSKQEILEAKRERLKKQLETIEQELETIYKQDSPKKINKRINKILKNAKLEQ